MLFAKVIIERFSPWARSALLLVLLSAAAAALIPADLLLQRNRASHALDATQRARAHAFADDLSLEATPEEFREKLPVSLPGLSRARAFFYYAAMAQMDRRETVLVAYVRRRSHTYKATEALHGYLYRVKARLRAEDDSDVYSVTQWPVAEDPPAFDFQTSDTALHVYHTLPWPEHLTRPLVERALQVGEEDLRMCHQDQEKVEQARQKYLQGHVIWLRWVDKLGKELAALSDTFLRGELTSQP